MNESHLKLERNFRLILKLLQFFASLYLIVSLYITGPHWVLLIASLIIPIYGIYLIAKDPNRTLNHPLPYVRYKALLKSKSWLRVDLAICLSMATVCIGFSTILFFGYFKMNSAGSFFLQAATASMLLGFLYLANAYLTTRQLHMATIDFVIDNKGPFTTITSRKSPLSINKNSNPITTVKHQQTNPIEDTSLLGRLRNELNEQQQQQQNNNNNNNSIYINNGDGNFHKNISNVGLSNNWDNNRKFSIAPSHATSLSINSTLQKNVWLKKSIDGGDYGEICKPSIISPTTEMEKNFRKWSSINEQKQEKPKASVLDITILNNNNKNKNKIYYASSFTQDPQDLKSFQQQTPQRKYSSTNYYIQNHRKYSNMSNAKSQIQSRISSATNLPTKITPKKISSASYFESNNNNNDGGGSSYKTTKHPYNRQRKLTNENLQKTNNNNNIQGKSSPENDEEKERNPLKLSEISMDQHKLGDSKRKSAIFTTSFDTSNSSGVEQMPTNDELKNWTPNSNKISDGSMRDNTSSFFHNYNNSPTTSKDSTYPINNNNNNNNDNQLWQSLAAKDTNRIFPTTLVPINSLNNLETDNISNLTNVHRAVPVQINSEEGADIVNNNKMETFRAKMVYSTSPTDTNTDSSESRNLLTMSEGSTIRMGDYEDRDEEIMNFNGGGIVRSNIPSSSIITDQFYLGRSTLINMNSPMIRLPKTSTDVLPPIAISIDSKRESQIREKKQILKQSIQNNKF